MPKINLGFLVVMLACNVANADWYVPAVDAGLMPGNSAGGLASPCWAFTTRASSNITNLTQVDQWDYQYVQCDSAIGEYRNSKYGVLVNYLFNPGSAVSSQYICASNQTGVSNCIEDFSGQRYGCFEQYNSNGKKLDACDICVDSVYRNGMVGSWIRSGDTYSRTVRKFVVNGVFCDMQEVIEKACPAGYYNANTAADARCLPCPDHAICTQTNYHVDSFKCMSGYYKRSYYHDCVECPNIEIIKQGSVDDGRIESDSSKEGVESCYITGWGEYIDDVGTFTFYTDRCYYVLPEV